LLLMQWYSKRKKLPFLFKKKAVNKKRKLILSQYKLSD